jgi:hypothetical protein
LNDVFLGSAELPQETFLSHLTTCLPIVDNGLYRQSVESQIGKPWRNQRLNEISLSLSAALLQLEAAGKIRLEARADAPQTLLLGRGGRELRKVSHIIDLRANDV